MNILSRIENKIIRNRLEKVMSELNNMSAGKANLIAILAGIGAEVLKELMKTGAVDFTDWKNVASAAIVAFAVAVAHRINPPKKAE